MQGDLISKSEVINLLCNLHIDNLAVNDKKVTEYIREIPIAYNVEKVVDQLEKNGQKMSEAKAIRPYAKHCPSDHRYYKAISVKKAVAIVRNGGKEYRCGINTIVMPTIVVIVIL